MKTNEEYEREFIAECKEKTGKTIEEWMVYLKPKGLTKPKETLDYLKSEEKLNHLISTFVSGIFLNGGKPVFDSKILFASHFENLPDQRKLYDAIEALIKSHIPNVQVVPTKGYISFRSEKEFAVTKINKTNIRIGMDLGDRPFDNYVEKAKSLGAMPRISHMVEVNTLDQVNDKLVPLLVEANKRVNV